MHRSPPMLALVSLACSVVLGCASDSEAQTRGAAEAPAATPPTATRPAATPGNDARVQLLSANPSRLAAPVSVVASPREPQPCEQMCGRVGECLDQHAAHEASALELSCLDLCVNVRDDAPVAPKFRGCDQHDSCDALISCAGQHWEAAQLARVEFDPLVDAAAVNPCDAYCSGIYGCMYYDKTAAQGLEFTPDTQREVDACISVCSPEDPVMIAVASCSAQTSCLEYWDCLESNSNNRW